MPILDPRGGHFGLILPLCTSSATVGLALYQYPVVLTLFRGHPDIAKNTTAPSYLDPLIKQGTALVATTALTSTVAGLFSARWLTTHATLETTDVSRWYLYGAILAAGHLASLPIVAGYVKRAVGSGVTKTDAETEEDLTSLLTIHTARTLLIDVPALLCFAEGVALSFWVI